MMKNHTFCGLGIFSVFSALTPKRHVFFNPNVPSGVEGAAGGAEKPKEATPDTEAASREAVIIYNSNYRSLSQRIEQYSASKNPRIQEIAQQYRDKLATEAIDPHTAAILNRRTLQDNIKRISSIIVEFGKEVQKASIEGIRKEKPAERDREQERERRGNAPEWLNVAVLGEPKKEFKREFEKAMQKLNAVKMNAYMNTLAEGGSNFVELKNRLAELNAKIDTAKNVDEITKMTKEVQSLAGGASIDVALKKDWANSLVSYYVGRAFDDIKPNENPSALLNRIRTNLRGFVDKEPFSSLPREASYSIVHDGVAVNVQQRGRAYVASITDIDPNYVNRYPRLAKYVKDKENKNPAV
jgi:hypothetical protein